MSNGRRDGARIAASTDSSTVSRGNTLVSWNDCTRPLRATVCGRLPPMLFPRNVTSPCVGLCTPVSSRKRVVLPAPFGPMIEWMLPSATSRSTSLTASNVPNRFVSARVERIVSATRNVSSSRAGDVPPRGAQDAGEAARPQQHDREQDDAEDELPALGVLDQPLLPERVHE